MHNVLATISLFDLEVPSFVLIKINQTVPGKIIILPGRKDSDFAFSPSGTTLLSGFWDGIEWLWTSDIFAPPPTVVSMNTSSTTTIVVVLSEAVTSTGTGWSFLKNGSPLLVSGFSGSGTNTLTFTVATMAQGDNLTASYDSTIGDTIDGSNVSLVSFTNSVVTNNIAGDPDASAFIAALAANGATQDSTHQGYIQTLFTGLKTDGLFTKLYALYIPIFGSAAANKFNVLNSIDSDGAFRLTFTGGFTYSSNGMNGDGLTGFANTHFNPSTNATINNIGIGVYSRVNGSAKTVVVGNYDGTNILSLQLATTPAANVTLNCTLSSNIAVSTVVTRLVYMQRNGSGGVIDVWRDGTELGPLSQGSTFVVNQPLYLSAINQSGSAAFFGDIPMSMILITDGSLSNTDAVNLTNRINTFLTNWGINV